MKTKKSVLLIVATAICLVAAAMAADQPATATQKTQAQPQAMPQMGPPAEMKQLEYLVGTWDYTMKMKMDTSANTMDSKGTSTCAYILDNAALTTTLDGAEMMGMKFKGLGITTWDRENKCWQMTWTDNMSGRTSLYTGQHTGDQTVYQGEDQMGGMKSLARMTSFNEKATSYDWKMESSTDGGKTWAVVATATYTKRK